MRGLLLSLSALVLLNLPAAAAEEPLPLPWLDEPAAVAVDCGQAPFELANLTPIDPGSVEQDPVPGGPVKTSNRNCICPHAGSGWVKTGDSCVYHPATALCSGSCYWENEERMLGTTTECGSP